MDITVRKILVANNVDKVVQIKTEEQMMHKKYICRGSKKVDDEFSIFYQSIVFIYYFDVLINSRYLFIINE